MQNTAGPTILKSSEQLTPQNPKNNPNWFKKNMLLVGIAFVVLVAVIFGAYSYLSPQGMRGIGVLQPKINEMTGAQLSLIPEKPVYKVGESVSVDVKLFTGGQPTASTDLAVKYDPQYLKPTRENFVVVGQIYPDYPPAQVEEKEGLIGVSGINFESNQNFSGVGLFGKLNFTALKEGQTEIMIDYQPNETGDSNVVLSVESTDILGSVENAKITISNTNSANSETLPETCGSFTQYCQDGSGKVGSQVCNAGTIFNDTCGYSSKLTTSCKACKI